jgi:hypothetical protein
MCGCCDIRGRHNLSFTQNYGHPPKLWAPPIPPIILYLRNFALAAIRMRNAFSLINPPASAWL